MKWLIFLISILPGAAFAEPVTDVPPRFRQFVDNVTDVTASFLQTKTMPESTKKFVATGKVRFVKGTGFIWKQLTPTNMTFISTKDKYCTGQNEATDLKSLPYFGQIARMIDGVLNGNFKEISTVFNLDYNDIGKNGWRIVAVPKIATVSGFLSKITFNGSVSDLTSVRIQYANGAQINIDFQKTSNGLTDEIKC